MKAEDVMALIQAHFRGERERFHGVALMVAANDPKLWGGDFARRVRQLAGAHPPQSLTALPRGESGQDSVCVADPPHRLEDLILPDEAQAAVGQVVAEHAHAERLEAHGLRPALKVLFDGPPGTGKTSAAGALAAALGVPFVTAKQHELVNSHMGESDKAVARLFDFAGQNRAVVMLDEFDAIGSTRSDAGSAASKAMNSLVTTLLQMFDRHRGPGVVVAATNLPGELDPAVRRRFDVAATFRLPTDPERRELIRRTLGDDDGPFAGSHAEIVRDCLREKKRRVLAALGVAA